MGIPKSNFVCYIVVMVFSLGLSVLSPSHNLQAHGSEGHEENTFTNYDALKKSLELFDTLLMKEKLGQGWERSLSEVLVLRSVENNQAEIMVKISRQKGKPESLYVFFDEKGKYKGSNFKGK